MDDGKLTLDEINAAFSTVDKSAKTVADVKVEERQAADAAALVAAASLSAVVVASSEDDEDYN